jgi:hypothetical protein
VATPPTFVAEYEVADWLSSTTPRTGSVTVAAGDYLVVIAGTENNNGLSTPSGGGLTYTPQQTVDTVNFAGCTVWTAPCATSQTFTLSMINTLANNFGWNALRFSGSGGIGGSAKTTGSGAPSLAVTTTGDNSAIVVINTDWNALDGSSRVWRTVNAVTPTSGNGLEVTYARSPITYGVYGAYYSDAGTAGSKTVGLSQPTGQAYATIAVEVLGTASAGPPPPYPPRRRGPNYRR